MKSLSLKVMTLLMAAWVLSASGCFNDEMSSSEGTVKGFLKAMNHHRNPIKKMQSYWDPARVPDKNTFQLWYLNCFYKLIGEELGGEAPERIPSYEGIQSYKTRVALFTSNVKTTLVSEKVGNVWKGDKWHPQKQATVKVSYMRTLPTDKAIMFDNRQDTVKLVK
jgi:hypothetical protein